MQIQKKTVISLILLFCLLLLLVEEASSFVPFSNNQLSRKNNGCYSKTVASTTTQIYNDNKNNNGQPKTYYNDDAFGLVFLGGAIGAQDPIFAGTFLALSSIAALGCAKGKFPSNDSSSRIPAIVAGISLVLTPIISKVIDSLPPPEQQQLLFLETTTPGNPSARLVELGLCSVSILYGFIISASKSKSSS